VRDRDAGRRVDLLGRGDRGPWGPHRLRPSGRSLRAQARAGGGLLAQALGALGFLFAGDLYQFYIVAAVFGFIYAGVMPLYAVLIRENFPMTMLGTIMGGTSMAGSLGMATGPVLGGWIFDATGGYGGLYVTSFALGLGAFLIARSFRPFPRSPDGTARALSV
jgi:MFS family permease